MKNFYSVENSEVYVKDTLQGIEIDEHFSSFGEVFYDKYIYKKPTPEKAFEIKVEKLDYLP